MSCLAFMSTLAVIVLTFAVLSGFQELMDDSLMDTLSLAGLLLEWASAEYKRTLRDGGIPEDAAVLAQALSRIELSTAYLRMVETGQHGNSSSIAGVYAWGLNAGGQLGIDHER